MDICNYLCDEDIFTLLKKYDSARRMSHIQRVAYYSNKLINLLWQLHGFNEWDRTMLKYSSLLHDIGYFINKEKHHEHSKYIVLTDGFFDKLPMNERNILAVLVSSHRKKLDKEISYYPRREQRKIIELVSILRLADALDYDVNNLIDASDINNNSVMFKVIEYPGMKDLKKLNEKSQLFKDTFNLSIEFCL